jgi:hypothetical protein
MPHRAHFGTQLPRVDRVLLAQHRIRQFERKDGLGIDSIIHDVFYAATVRFFETPHARLLIPDPSCQSPLPATPLAFLTYTNISRLIDATAELREVGAKLVHSDEDVHLHDPVMFLPEPSTFLHQGDLMDLDLTVRKASNQQNLYEL